MYFCQVTAKHFLKYHGAGNDFVMADNRNGDWSALSLEQRALICHRRFGVGADGLILLENDFEFDFRMVYYNSDGRQSSMCGNGGRCIAAFANKLGIINDKTTFVAIDGVHEAVMEGDVVRLKMRDVPNPSPYFRGYFINTGSPHYVEMVEDVEAVSLIARAREIRYNSDFAFEGVNVNFFEITPSGLLKVRTYERGVEDETFACGTGVTAVAIAASSLIAGTTKFDLQAKGGLLRVSFDQHSLGYHNIWLCGGAQFVFEGSFAF
jgi:diaminopimelate epimerase